MQQQMAAMQAQAVVPDLLAQIQQLAQPKEVGLLTEDEFALAKSKLQGA